MGAVSKIRVGVNGAKGRMGRITVEGLEERGDMELVFSADRGDDLAGSIRRSDARVVVDFTVPDAVFENVMTIVRAGASPVVGTTGLKREQLDLIEEELLERKLGGIVAPNFSVGAMLMMKFSSEAAQRFDHCEIIELHHERKLDSPSGTALMTAEEIAKSLDQRQKTCESTRDAKSPSRGENKKGVQVHSVRLPGLIARQQVMFGGLGETLTISHEVTSRECFLPGILLAIRDAPRIQGLQIGLNL